MTRFQVIFKGRFFDIVVSGDSSEEVVQEYERVSKELEKALHGRFPQAGLSSPEKKQTPFVEDTTLESLAIPALMKSKVVEFRSKLSNWEILFILLHHAPNGLSNKQIRTLSEEVGKPISAEWLNTEFHRRRKEGLVISRRPAGSKAVTYFLAEPGKKEAKQLMERLSTIA